MEIVTQVLMFLLILLIICIFFYWSYRENNKQYNKIKQEKNSTNAYLETVRRRASMSTSTEALELLWDEMNKSLDIYTYYQDTFIEFKCIRSFIRGKYYGLIKSDKLITEFHK